VLATIPLTLGYAIFGEPYRPVFKRHRVRLTSAWPNLKVLHISDLHVRASDKRLHRAQTAALKALAEQPDVLCVTGDIAEKVAEIEMVIDLLKTVRPRYGTFVVLGNHEHNAPMPSHLVQEHKGGWRRLLSRTLHRFAP